ncbi:MAG: type II CAAX endopeptidase family protein [Clostridia bacterium]|nr:type II CAAX endopeptidase family protein [Clostridia bacterium]
MNRKRAFNMAWCIVLLQMVLVIFKPYAGSVFLNLFFGEMTIVIPILIGLFILKIEGREDIKNALGIKGMKIEHIAITILIAIAFHFFIYTYMPLVNVGLVRLFGDVEYVLPKSDLASIFLLCVMAPVLEELLMRGVVLTLLRRAGDLWAIIFSALAFALIHINAVSIVQIFFMGMLLGVLRIRTGSVLAPILLHSISNFMTFVTLNHTISYINVLTIASMAMFPILLWLFMERTEGVVKIKKRAKSFGRSPAMAIVILVFLAINIYQLI